MIFQPSNQITTEPKEFKELKEKKSDISYAIDTLKRMENSRLIRSSVGYSLAATFTVLTIETIVIYQEEKEAFASSEAFDKVYKKGLTLNIVPLVIGLGIGSFNSMKLNSERKSLREYQRKKDKIDIQINEVKTELEELLNEKKQLKTQI